MQFIRLAIAVIVLTLIGSMLWQSRDSGSPAVLPLVELRDTGGPLRIAVTGDTLAGPQFDADGVDPSVTALLERADLALTDLDQPVTEVGMARTEASRPQWPAVSQQETEALRALGFGIVTLANDHAGGIGGNDAERTRALLQRAGLRSAGAGRDLDEARQPAIIGTAPRRIAVLSMTTSAPPDARAARARGDIAGRPGVNVLRYSALITADPAAFGAFAQMARTMSPDSPPEADGSLKIAGTVIKPGARTGVELIADPEDVRDLLDQIRSVRSRADIVIVSLHTHEPGNRSETPADFVREFARHCIDAGAAVVAAHGPRQLRGIEIYKGGAIFYSLGSFVFQPTAIPAGSETVFDTDVSAYDVALDAIQPTTTPRLPDFDEPFWWEAVIGALEFDGQALRSIVVTPLDLADAGLPRVAVEPRTTGILDRLTRLSAPFGTKVNMQSGRGVIFVERAPATTAR